MKNDQERHACSEADKYTMPNPTVAPHLFLIVSRHHSDCIATLLESKYPFRAGFDFVIARTELSRDALLIV
jgi:hypothetical protein